MSKNTPFRYDYVGSFLRPETLKKARRDFEEGKISKEELTKVEDDAILDLVEKQKKAGYHVITDGEFRRATWHLDFMWGFNGVGHEPTKTGLCVKDESYRFGLNAFKVLGGSFAMANYIADETGKDVADCTFDYLTSDQLAKDFGQATFFTATDGNHGRGVAWAANKLGQKAVVHMPKGSTKPRFDNIAAEGATVTIEEVNYDECVRMAAAEADACERGVIVQDTAWEGYEKIPSWIMEGYGTMASEAAEQLREMAINRPTHVFVQAGVGSLAGAVVGYFTNLYPDNPPTFVVVECAPAACLYKGAAAGDGDPRIVDGDMPSIMAGLCCGEPNILGWDILRNHTTAFVSCPDWVTARGMRTLGAPEKGDPRVISGESGAVTTGLVETLMLDPEYAELKELIGLDKTGSVLCFSTEGDTDPDQYRRIVWEGEYPTC